MPHPTRKQPDTALPATALFALLLVCLLLLTTAGAAVYRLLTAAADEAGSRRAALAYLSARVRAADEAGAIALGTGPEGDALILADPGAGSGYATRIYLHEGSLVEDYAPTDAALDPEDAQPIAEADTFAVEADGRLVTLRTEQGTVRVALHCGEVAP